MTAMPKDASTARSRLLASSVVVVAALFGGCQTVSSDDGRPVTLRVLAASSLTDVMSELERSFERGHPTVDIVMQFGGSIGLANQIAAGAPADVFVSADHLLTQRALDAGDVTEPVDVATNRLALVVAQENPRSIRGLDDLDRPGIVFVMCGPAVPCGRLGDAILRRHGVKADPAARERNVKAVVGRVLLGEADAGIAYVTDVRAVGGRVAGLPIGPDDPELAARYVAAVVSGSDHRAEARAWVTFLAGPEGQRRLAHAGLTPPHRQGWPPATGPS